MLQYLLDDIRIFNRSVRRIDNDPNRPATLFTLLYPKAAPSILKRAFKQALDEKSFKEGRRITLNEVSDETGISRPTLTRVSNVPGYNTNTHLISALCDYFEIESGELLKKV
ncbi:helix-turn-helix domain-containing protein [Pseudomonadales bacterium]|nr:helix-turn-helix domain-containing protein [Pseudomonadales bacterium]